ncbi:MAG: hypothetical protein IKD47_04560 [Clostridia bacterium]|nr:hypothetical protein [Clostridia bacterium]
MKKIYVSLIVLALLCGISVVGGVVTICFTVSMLKVYPRPLDSFWSFELSILLLLTSAILFAFSIVGIVVCVKKLKKGGRKR